MAQILTHDESIQIFGVAHDANEADIQSAVDVLTASHRAYKARKELSMTTLVNLTPHAINICNDTGECLLSVAPSGRIARVSADTVVIGSVDICGIKILITSTAYGAVENLPDPEEGTIYIVSSLVASRVPDRTDVVIPNESVRDSEGRIVGCKSLGRV